MNQDIEISTSVIEKIKQQDYATLQQLYKEAYPMVRKYVNDNSGNDEDAKDIFQDAMYLFIRKISEESFQLTSKLSTFIYGIGRNLWLKKLTKKEVDEKAYQHEREMETLEDEEVDQLEQTKFVNRCIEQLGEPCKTIIVQFYYFQKSMEEIAGMLHYTNANNAKNQKYKCFNRLKKMIFKQQ